MKHLEMDINFGKFLSHRSYILNKVGRFEILLASVAQLDAHPIGDQKLRVQPPPGRQLTLVEIDHEIIF